MKNSLGNGKQNLKFFSRYMYRSFPPSESDVICRGNFQERMEADSNLRCQRAPGTGAQTNDAGRVGGARRNRHAQPAKNRSWGNQRPAHHRVSDSIGTPLSVEAVGSGGINIAPSCCRSFGRRVIYKKFLGRGVRQNARSEIRHLKRFQNVIHRAKLAGAVPVFVVRSS